MKAKDAVKTSGCPKKISIQSSIKMFIYFIPMLLRDAINRVSYIEQMINSLKRLLIPIRNNRSYSRKKKHTDRKYRNNLK